MAADGNVDLLSLTSEIVSSMVANNKVDWKEVSGLIQSTYEALAMAGSPPAPEPEAPTPAVSIKASVKPDYIVCLECGAKQKMLKRHLNTAHSLTPAEYLAKWNLPRTYPLVSPDYAAQRAELAVKIGLGTKGGRKAALKPAAKTTAKKAPAKGVAAGLEKARQHLGGEALAKPPAKRGRPPKSTVANGAKE